MPQNRKIQWHPGFYAAAEIELRENREELEFHREYNLSKKPLQIDLLIIEKLKDVQIQNEIGKLFRRYNIIEYKSPEDSLSIDDFFKTLGYAYLYKGLGEWVNQIPLEELTVSFFHECASSFTEPGDRRNADAILQVSISANRRMYEQIRRSEDNMCEALRELFKDELEDAREKGIVEGKSEGENRLNELYNRLEQDGRREEIFLAMKNPELLKKFYKEYGMA